VGYSHIKFFEEANLLQLQRKWVCEHHCWSNS